MFIYSLLWYKKRKKSIKYWSVIRYITKLCNIIRCYCDAVKFPLLGPCGTLWSHLWCCELSASSRCGMGTDFSCFFLRFQTKRAQLSLETRKKTRKVRPHSAPCSWPLGNLMKSLVRSEKADPTLMIHLPVVNLETTTISYRKAKNLKPTNNCPLGEKAKHLKV